MYDISFSTNMCHILPVSLVNVSALLPTKHVGKVFMWHWWVFVDFLLDLHLLDFHIKQNKGIENVYLVNSILKDNP